MNRFGRSTSAHSSLAERDGRRRCRGRGRGDLDGDPAVDAAGGVEGRPRARRRRRGRRSVVIAKIASSTSLPGRGELARPGRRTARRRRARWRRSSGWWSRPTTELFLTSSARLPVSMRSRDRSSSQMDTPASARALSRSVIGFLPGVLRCVSCCRVRALGGSALRVGDALLGGQRHGLGGDAELAVERGVVGRGAVVLEARRCGRRRRRGRASPCATPASTLTRALTIGRQHGVAVGLRPAASNHSRHGIETTRAWMPFVGQDARGPRRRAAPRSRCRSGSRRARRPRRRAARSRRGRRSSVVGEAVGAAREGRDVLPGQRQAGRVGRCARGSPARRRRSRWRRPGGRRRGPGSRAARRGARPAGGSGRPRRGRSSRGSRRR